MLFGVKLSHADSIQGTETRAPTFTNDWARGEPRVEEQKQECYHTVLTIMKALTKTTNCIRTAKNLHNFL